MKPASIHPTAINEARKMGRGVQIGAYSHIASGATIGNGCVISAHVRIGRDAHLGERVSIEGPTHLCAAVEVEDDVFIGSGVGFSEGKPIVLKRGCRIGANATLAAGISIGERTVVDTGAVVLQSVPSNVVVAGHPAKVVGFADTEKSRTAAAPEPSTTPRVIESKVQGVRAHELPYISDPRGNLTVGEFGKSLPFVPKRYFVTFDVPNFHLRGEHAHRVCEQFLVCVHGACAVVVDDGFRREEFLLDRPTFGVYVPPMVWATEYKHSADSTLLVFASHHYDPADYIRDYDEFRAQARKPPRKKAR